MNEGWHIFTNLNASTGDDAHQEIRNNARHCHHEALNNGHLCEEWEDEVGEVLEPWVQLGHEVDNYARHNGNKEEEW